MTLSPTWVGAGSAPRVKRMRGPIVAPRLTRGGAGAARSASRGPCAIPRPCTCGRPKSRFSVVKCVSVRKKWGYHSFALRYRYQWLHLVYPKVKPIACHSSPLRLAICLLYLACILHGMGCTYCKYAVAHWKYSPQTAN